jgi:hypothetical protein
VEVSITEIQSFLHISHTSARKLISPLNTQWSARFRNGAKPQRRHSGVTIEYDHKRTFGLVPIPRFYPIYQCHPNLPKVVSVWLSKLRHNRKDFIVKELIR